MQCTQCQHEFAEGTKFCPECGFRVADMQAVPTTAVEEPAPGSGPNDTEATPAPIEPTPEATVPEPSTEPAPAEPAAAMPERPPVVTEPVPEIRPAPAAPAVMAAPSAPPSPGIMAPARIVEPPPPKKKRKRHGCLISFGVFLLLIGIAAVVLFDLPMRLGLISSPAERMFTGKADRQAEAVLAKDFEEARQPTQGISFVVLPYWGRGYSLAYVVLDASKGYHYVDTGFEDPIFAAFQIVARSKAVQQAQIYRVAVEFREADGVTLSVLTAPVFAIQQYAAKTIDKKQFIAKMDGHANLIRMYKDQYTWLGGPQ